MDTEIGSGPAAAPAIRRVPFLGVEITALGVKEAAELIAARPPGAPFAYVVTPNAAHFTRLGELKDARFADAYAHSWLRLLDGATPRRLAKLVFGLDIPQAAGSDLTTYLFAHCIRPGDTLTVIGGSEEMRRRLMEQYRLGAVNLHIPSMGFINRPEEVEACVDFVVAHPARYVFFVVGAPPSEYLARMVAGRGGAVGTGLCVGSSLNFVTGIVERAPDFYRRNGLEWLHRLLLNPKGHARRVFVDSLPVLWMVAKARLDPAAYGMAPKRPGAGGGAP
ncbi:WecB/TagA/CpsF family glycosyltransferase [Xanthobacter tagetidis]|jgi:exopolysaccharide biosynthesis WecB/TagA/CpsF family protein|uniref:Glycosyltransferase n=1 Tax=Xanthobacter tagetidis TaxID=60216 RepID=A0A3L7AQV8_9HYPH|nr:WecB/TagA/CpsF family glycosyltransferase [Xanthobacter tagetidis]MBB6308167.1 exopolysaccharide biosynthesis WecB/TagA/CpsF family protein [Xanthobacter tagetidis]RLP81788.1 glycosyltransferase [Xanthobacter tagetidis]